MNETHESTGQGEMTARRGPVVPADDDRPAWLPPPTTDRSNIESRWKRARTFLLNLPSLALVAVGIGCAMLAGASLFAAKAVTGGRRTDFSAVAGLLIAAFVAFAAAAALRSPRWLSSRLRSTTAAAAGGQMSAQQFFGALLRGLAIWQLLSAVIEIPQTVVYFMQVSSAGGGAVGILRWFILTPVLWLALGVLLLFNADRVAKMIYPSE